ncbi:hypothetical protein DIE23_34370 [Burkholderia sp. Bp9143]|uniref:hypothetical protein n=1 Tax=Burkholderia sp. Bp9143 TaxID=2184574 RepID=UPI000F5B2C40|nr:hypothetical protein [Burkholderia sp. Bp9143]RQR23994.1 hypothetical protein DIE23_34370 [Burkholderia sp. Bp9143]
MDIEKLDWAAPWRSLSTEQEAVGLQRQLDRELTGRHPLSGRGATVIGRRVDRDDVLVVLFDGTYANVHLTWGLSSVDQFADEYPTWFAYGTLDDFVLAMSNDSRDDGDA